MNDHGIHNPYYQLLTWIGGNIFYWVISINIQRGLDAIAVTLSIISFIMIITINSKKFIKRAKEYWRKLHGE